MSQQSWALTRFTQSCRTLWPALLSLLLPLMLLTACGSSTPANSDASVQITLLPERRGNNLQVQLRQADQTPITDATVTLEANMNHAGMAPVMAKPVKDSDDGAADGIYTVPLPFSMLGDWIITVTADLADGAQATQEINVTVTDTGVQMQAANNSSTDQSPSSQAKGTMASGALMVHEARVRAVPMAGGNGALYFIVMNGTTQADRLVGVECDVAATAEMHESINENNVVRMEPRPDGFEIPAGGTVELAPGGKHVMLTNLKAPLVEGESITVTLRFAHAAPMSVTVPIMALGSDMAGEHHHDGN